MSIDHAKRLAKAADERFGYWLHRGPHWMARYWYLRAITLAAKATQ